MSKDTFIIDLKPIYEFVSKNIEEDNKSCKEDNVDYMYTFKNYEFIMECISDYFFDNKIFEKIKEKLIKMGSDKE